MKHLLLFEAFESDTISKINKFLTKKIGKSASNAFISGLKKLNYFDFPIDQIKDSDVEYISKKKALPIKAPKNWKPKSEYNIYAFKFWFSLEKGYLGYTGIGDKEVDFEGTNSGDRNNKPFNDSEVEYIKNNLGIKSGILTPVSDYNSLKHGEEVIGYFNDSRILESLLKAKIYLRGSSIFAIQNGANGGDPNDDEWRNWGRYSWSLGDKNSPSDDHQKLHKYTKTDNDLEVKNTYNKSENYLNWNLPLNYEHLTSWSDVSSSYLDVIEKADFCIMLNFDNIIKRGYKKVSGTQKERIESKEGATALLLDDQIKNLNFKRYMDKMIANMGITKDSNIEDLKNLSKILRMAICEKYPIYSLFSSDGTWFIRNFVSNISELIEYKSDYEFNRLREKFESMKNQSIKLSKKYKKSEDYIFSSDNKELIEMFNMIKSLNDKITNYILSENIETLSDVKSIYLKLIYIKELFDDELIGRLKTRSMITNMNDPYDIDHYIEHFKNRDDLFEQDIKKLEKVVKYIESVLN